MSKKEKLIARLKEKPKDFTFEEVIQLMGYFDYRLVGGGKTGGSRVALRIFTMLLMNILNFALKTEKNLNNSIRVALM